MKNQIIRFYSLGVYSQDLGVLQGMIAHSFFADESFGSQERPELVVSSADTDWGIGTLVTIPFLDLRGVGIDEEGHLEVAFKPDTEDLKTLKIFDLRFMGNLEKWCEKEGDVCTCKSNVRPTED